MASFQIIADIAYYQNVLSNTERHHMCVLRKQINKLLNSANTRTQIKYTSITHRINIDTFNGQF